MRAWTRNRRLIWLAVSLAALALLPASASAQSPSGQDPGALISMTMKGTVGVLLDEIPAGKWREQAAQEALDRKGDDEFWVKRAKRQVRLTYYRLVFRGFYYPAGK